MGLSKDMTFGFPASNRYQTQELDAKDVDVESELTLMSTESLLHRCHHCWEDFVDWEMFFYY